MPLTIAQKIEARSLLQVRAGNAGLPAAGSLSGQVDQRLAALNADEIAAVIAILTEYAAVKYDTGILQGEYSDNPAQKRALLRVHLLSVLNIDPAHYAPADAPEIGRG